MRIANASCHNCGALGLEHFYSLSDIPVSSTVLLDTAEEAAALPTGDLKLGFCSHCGFIENFVFDPSIIDHTMKFEESQGFSARFMKFLRELTGHLVQTYDVRNKRVLEIGCGKGEFLELLCEIGDNRGVGIDPGVSPQRITEDAAQRIELIEDFFSERHADRTGDFVACRHTLEHILPTQAFVRLLRRSIRDDTIVFFEVPDVERIVAEPAFWDIYYEHCAYFSLASLRHLFASCGFEILELEKTYGDQYLVLVAKPTRAAPPSPDRELVSELEAHVSAFVTQAEKTRARWRQVLDARRAENKKVVVWGSSSKGVSFLTSLGVTDEVGYVVDINTFRQNKFMPGSGHEIVSPERMKSYRPDTVIAMNPIYTDEIRDQLAGMGVEPEMLAV